MIHTEEKKTPLYEAHKSLNAKIVSFHDWLLPIQYTSIVEEHNATRQNAGLFDISHLGKIGISGKGSLEFLQRVFTNDVTNSASQRIVYSPLCNENGGILDDTFIYNPGKDRYILIVNAATFEKDFNWLKANNPLTSILSPEGRGEGEGVVIRDINDSFGGIALQGPASVSILKGLCEADLNKLKRRRFCETKVEGFSCLLSRSGYTGEDGFEIFVASENTEKLWYDFLKIGRSYGLLPAGLGARDTLRLEAGCPLYGIDVDESKTPLEAKLDKAVDFNKDFIGKKAILERKANGIKEILVGFKVLDKAIPRTGYLIERAKKKIGLVTSGTYSPTLKESIGFGYVDLENSKIASQFDIVIHGSERKAEVVEVPFYRRVKGNG